MTLADRLRSLTGRSVCSFYNILPLSMMTRHIPFLLILLSFLSESSFLYAERKDSLEQKKIKEVIVTAPTSSSFHTQTDGRIYWDIESLEDLPHVFGSADPFRFLQLLPGVSTNNDYTSGLFIQGCAASHTEIDIMGAPIFNASHMLGLFSVFNNSHFRGMALVQNRHDASFGNRLGGHLTFYPLDSVATAPHLNLTLSLIESSGTLTIPTGDKSTLYLSGRGSYLNLLYGNALSIDGSKVEYGLQDYNIGYVFKPDQTQKIGLNIYHGRDKFNFWSTDFQGTNDLAWQNTAISLDWNKHYQPFVLNQTAYISHNQNDFDLEINSVKSLIDASITQAGYKNTFEWQGHHTIWKAGFEYAFTSVSPLNYKTHSSYINTESHSTVTYGHDANLFINADNKLGDQFRLQSGLRTSFYINNHNKYGAIDPRLTLSWLPVANQEFFLHYGIYHQNIHQIALSNGGLPIDYWTNSSTKFKPERAHSLSFGYLGRFLNGTYELSADVYFKHLSNQTEFYGSILDFFLQQDNRFKDMLLTGKGRSYGISLMLKRNKGKLTGWIAYTLGKSERQFQALQANWWYNAYFDRRHDLNIVANYKLNRHWSLGGDFVYASGTPYTAAKNIYIINNNLVNEYGSHNGANLPPTHRLDLSATYYFTKKNKIQHSLNLSVYNVYFHRNVLFQYMGYWKDHYGKKSVHSICRALPSIGYTIKF